MLLELNEEEQQVFIELLDREIQDLGPEIHHTQTSSYRDELRARKELLARLRDRLSTPHPSAHP